MPNNRLIISLGMHELAYANQYPALQLEVGQPIQTAWLRPRNKETVGRKYGERMLGKGTTKMGILSCCLFIKMIPNSDLGATLDNYPFSFWEMPFYFYLPFRMKRETCSSFGSATH